MALPCLHLLWAGGAFSIPLYMIITSLNYFGCPKIESEFLLTKLTQNKSSFNIFEQNLFLVSCVKIPQKAVPYNKIHWRDFWYLMLQLFGVCWDLKSLFFSQGFYPILQFGSIFLRSFFKFNLYPSLPQSSTKSNIPLQAIPTAHTTFGDLSVT